MHKKIHSNSISTKPTNKCEKLSIAAEIITFNRLACTKEEEAINPKSQTVVVMMVVESKIQEQENENCEKVAQVQDVEL